MDANSSLKRTPTSTAPSSTARSWTWSCRFSQCLNRRSRTGTTPLTPAPCRLRLHLPSLVNTDPNPPPATEALWHTMAQNGPEASSGKPALPPGRKGHCPYSRPHPPSPKPPASPTSAAGPSTAGWRTPISATNWLGSIKKPQIWPVARLQGVMLQAVLALADSLQDPNPEIRLRAIRTALNYSVKWSTTSKACARNSNLSGPWKTLSSATFRRSSDTSMNISQLQSRVRALRRKLVAHDVPGPSSSSSAWPTKSAWNGPALKSAWNGPALRPTTSRCRIPMPSSAASPRPASGCHTLAAAARYLNSRRSESRPPESIDIVRALLPWAKPIPCS